MIVILAGPIGSGKSTLAKAIGQALHAPVAGFGNYVRSIAVARGLDETDRTVLQDLGHGLVEGDPRKFVDKSLAWAEHQPGNNLVLDGLRHISVLEALRDRASEGLDAVTLIYLDTPLAVRRARVAARGVAVEGMETTESHPVEQDLHERLKTAADGVVNGATAIDDLVGYALGIIRPG